LAIKTLGVNLVEHLETNGTTKELAMEDQTPNIHVVQSVWRRIKKAKIHDLEPIKDVKGGGGAKGTSKSTPGGTGNRGK
jgi:hypothetical protein